MRAFDIYPFLREKWVVGLAEMMNYPALLEGDADVVAVNLRCSPSDTRFTVRSPAGEFDLRTALVGDFKVSNILAATAAALALGLRLEAIQRRQAAPP